MTPEAQLAALGVVAGAMALGALVGLDREIADKPAGVRTHMLVAGASALLVEVGEALLWQSTQFPAGIIRADPIRYIEAVVTGVTVLGAGTIIRQHAHHVEGLTTAASLFFVSGLGIAAAAGQWIIAAGGAVSALAVLRVLGWLTGRIRPHHRHHDRPPD